MLVVSTVCMNSVSHGAVSACSLNVVAWGSLAASARAGGLLLVTRGVSAVQPGKQLGWSLLDIGTVPLA